LHRDRSRRARLVHVPPLAAPLSEPALCFLCGRPLGRRVEWHHPVPKSRGGRDTVPIHPLCHRTIHATLTNSELERGYADAASLRAHPQIARFIEWVSDKDPDFHAPTRRRR
jgi:hypothetical protein